MERTAPSLLIFLLLVFSFSVGTTTAGLSPPSHYFGRQARAARRLDQVVRRGANGTQPRTCQTTAPAVSAPWQNPWLPLTSDEVAGVAAWLLQQPELNLSRWNTNPIAWDNTMYVHTRIDGWMPADMQQLQH